ncbi:Multidrug resistance protein MexB [Planctomycetes bacterium Poly30]|uniref:Multidrug resistance protein MexB n=1 Tax=Saltatorellus ferox TaxID=2528018 RepID=A0A518ENX1_9BACT|nr:Multidrug resistance protein MexB [Planctomycetes bacterium Poly30]
MSADHAPADEGPATEPYKSPGGPIAWMATNSIAANLVMIVLMVGGLIFATQVTQEVFPEFDLDQVVVRVPYPGASPAEVEQGILLAIEDQVSGVDDVKKVTSQALEGVGTVTIELVLGGDTSKALQDVKNEIDRITTFPLEAEEPVVSLAERPRKVMSVLVHGPMPEASLRTLTERVRDLLIAHEDITVAELGAAKGYEIAVEIPSANLRSYGLTLPSVASTIQRAALELPAGEVRTQSGEILLRTQERRDLGAEFADLPLVTTDAGSVVRARDIGQVVDAFAEDDIEATYNGQPAMEITVNRVGKETPLAVAQAVRDVLADLRIDLPEGVGVTVWDDQSKRYEERLDLLGRNAIMGLGLVLLLLGLFLEPRVAFWVTMGIVISVLGSFVVFPTTGATINMVSLFAFIVTLGIIVDDAIIVGENIFEKRQNGVPALQAAIEGTREIAGPVVFAVLTNIIAFMPLFFVPGSIGKIFRQIPAVVVSVFAISLIESLFILPAHLSHDSKPGKIMRALSAPSLFVTRVFDRLSERWFAPLVDMSLRNRYLIPALGVALLIISIGIVGGGLIRSSFLPRIDSDVVTATARLPVGVPISEARRVRAAVQASIAGAIEDLNEDPVGGIYTQIGGTSGSANELSLRVELLPPSERKTGGIEFSRVWRQATGEVPGVESLTFSATSMGPGGKAIDIQLTGPEQKQLEQAARDLTETLGRYEGVSDLDDGTASGKRQLSFSLTPEALSLGLTAQDVAAQVRASFFGAEALRQQRGRNEVKVLVRLPREERERLSTVEDLMLRTPSGGEIPLSVATKTDEGRSYTSIDRRDSQRIIAVTGDVDPTVGDANVILDSVREKDLAELAERYPGLGYSFEGEQESRRESLSALALGMGFALFSIFAMLAIPLKSYSLPLIVLSGAPFGIIGALMGHFVLGYGLSLMSMFGIIALTGVVVNDSLVLVVTANLYRDRGMTAFEAMHQASVRRLRPIMLTSLTTSLGLLPMMLESSAQARFLVPMAISLGFGVLFSTLVILLLVPCLYLIREDVIDIARVARGKKARGDGLGAASHEIAQGA